MDNINGKLKLHIERLIKYAIKKELIYEEDVIVSRNTLLDFFQLDEPLEAADSIPDSDCHVSEILDTLIDLAHEKGIYKTSTTTERDLLSAKIMGFLTARQSEVTKRFNELYSVSHVAATDYFYNLSINTDYIKTSRTDKNICWSANTKAGMLDITINLSKPEKDPRDIAAAKLIPASNYPKCLLCAENAGYAGRGNHPARQNHRIVKIMLNNEKWYMQYSPYLYYNEHCIVLYEKHVPMSISSRTFALLLDFVEMFPHYFIGSNADLPIVGGSILSHDHFQGGRHKFPMESAKEVKSFRHNEFNIKASVLNWPLSTIRLVGGKSEIIECASHILDKWRTYTDETAEIIASSKDSNGNNVMHNTVTPIARKQGDSFVIDIVLRNNRTSETHPLGIFHPHSDVHHIKKENIGLIEVMGLAILPPRLKDEVNEIKKILMGKKEAEVKNEMEKHKDWIAYLLNKYGADNKETVVDGIIKEEIGAKFCRVLEDAGVYKQQRLDGFFKFIEHCGFNYSKATSNQL